jgi:hypothetical protein
MPRISIRVWTVPRSLISQRVKIPPVLFTRKNIRLRLGLCRSQQWQGVPREGDSGSIFDKTFSKSFLKSLRLSLARSKSEPVVGYANGDPPPLGGVRCLYGGVQTGNYHRGLACLLRVEMKTKGWLGDRGRSRIVLERGKEGIT